MRPTERTLVAWVVAKRPSGEYGVWHMTQISPEVGIYGSRAEAMRAADGLAVLNGGIYAVWEAVGLVEGVPLPAPKYTAVECEFSS